MSGRRTARSRNPTFAHSTRSADRPRCSNSTSKEPRVEEIMAMITAGRSAQRRQRNSKDSALLFHPLLLSPLWPLLGLSCSPGPATESRWAVMSPSCFSCVSS